MAKPYSRRESHNLSDYRWVKGRVGKRFREKYGRRAENARLAKFLKRQTSRARRRASNKFLEEWIDG